MVTRRGPRVYVAAYRHIVDVMRAAGADNLQWIWHVNWDDVPESHWNRLEKYFPGENYCTWMAISAYGPLTPQHARSRKVSARRSIKSIRA